MKIKNQMLLLLSACLLLLTPATNGFVAKARLEPPVHRGDKKVALAIDGGGLRGILSASILKRLEKSIQYQTQDDSRLIGESFDIIAGTSTGGILATYFSVPKLKGTAEGALKIYTENADKIFGKPKGVLSGSLFDFIRDKLGMSYSASGYSDMAWRAGMKKAKHSGKGLDEVLKSILPDLTFKQFADEPWAAAPRRSPSLLLVSYDVKYRRPVTFVADRCNHNTYFLRQEPLGVPFSPAFESLSKNPRRFPGDINRRNSIVRRWTEHFNDAKKKWFDGNEGFKFGPINFLGDVQIMRDVVAQMWQDLECEIADSIYGKDADAKEKHKETIIFGKTNLDKLEVWKAARATSSAPTFLPPMKFPNFYYRDPPEGCTGVLTDEAGYFCDGGIVANNPGLQALLYLMAHDEAIVPECNILDDSICEEEENIDCDKKKLQDLPKDWEKFDKGNQKNPLDNYALLSIGSGSTFSSAEVEGRDSHGIEWDASQRGSELWWISQEAKDGNLVSIMMDNLQMVANTSLRTLFALAGRENAYLRIQYRTEHFDDSTVPEHIDESLKKLDDPSETALKDYQDIGEYVADAYAGAIDQFVFLHVLTQQERDEFIKKDRKLAKDVFNGFAISELEECDHGHKNPSSHLDELANDLRSEIDNVLKDEAAKAQKNDQDELPEKSEANFEVF